MGAPFLDITPAPRGYRVVLVTGDILAGQYEVMGEFRTLPEACDALRAAEQAATSLRLMRVRP